MDTVRLGKLSIPLATGPGGNLLGASDPDLGPLQAIVNSALTGGAMKDLRQLLERGERTVSNPAIAISRPYPDEDYQDLARWWESVSGEPSGEDVYILETIWDRKKLLVPRLALLELLNQVESARSPSAKPPKDGGLDELEAKARQADQESGPDGRAQRKTLLALLETQGFFDPKYWEAISERLRRGYYPVVENYLSAIASLDSYYRSHERCEYIQPLDHPPLVGGPVSLEWFRKSVPTPDGMNPLSWLAFSEWLLRTANLSPDGANEFYSRVGGKTYHLRFRREDGEHPSLTWAEIVRSSAET